MESFNRKLTLLFFVLLPFITTKKIYGQCDLEIYDFNIETLETTLIVHNGFGCNPDDPTDDEIDKFILSITSEELQADDYHCGLTNNPSGIILQNYFPNFILWDDEAAYLGPDGILSTGDTLIFNLFDAQLGESYAEGCFLEADSLGYFDDCIEVAIYQINCSENIYGYDTTGEFLCYSYPDITPEDNIFKAGCDVDEETPEDEGDGCPDWTTLHIPNTFTPNNDGINDVWKIIYDLDCWENVEFRIFNRWGEEIYYGNGDWFDSYPFWGGNVNGGDHYVSDGVYVYMVKAKKVGSVKVIELTGHITVFR